MPSRGLAEGNHTSGGFPFLHKGYLNCSSAFFFGTRGANNSACSFTLYQTQFAETAPCEQGVRVTFFKIQNKLGKKETPQESFARCDERPTLRALDRRSLFEKSDGKTFLALRPKPFDKSKFEN